MRIMQGGPKAFPVWVLSFSVTMVRQRRVLLKSRLPGKSTFDKLAKSFRYRFSRSLVLWWAQPFATSPTSNAEGR
jgi:hypothetical protein